MAKIEIIVDDKGTPKLVKGSIEGLGMAVDKLGVQYDKTRGKVDAATKAHSQFGNVMRGLFAAFSVQKLVQLSEEYDDINDKLKLVSENTDALKHNMEALLEISNMTGTKIGANADLYQQLAIAAQGLGNSSTEAAGAMQTLLEANRLAGTSAEKSQAGIQALQKGLANGSVNLKQFNTILTSSPGIIAALTIGLDKSRTELQRMAEAGTLTGEKIQEGLHKANAAIVAMGSNSSQNTFTITEGFNALINSLTMFVGKADEAGGVANKIALVLKYLGDNIDTVVTVLLVLAGAWAIAQMVAFITTIGAAASAVLTLAGVTGGLTAAIRILSVAMLGLIANPLGLAITAIGLAIVGVIAAFGGWSEALAKVRQYLVDLGLGDFVTMIEKAYEMVKSLVASIWEFAKSLLGLKQSNNEAGGAADDNKARVKAFRDEVEKLEKASKDSQKQIGNLGNAFGSDKFEKGSKSVREASRSFTDYSKATHSAAVGGLKMADANGNLIDSFGGIASGANGATGAINGMASAFGNAAGAAYNMNEAMAASTAASQGGGAYYNNGNTVGYGPDGAGIGPYGGVEFQQRERESQAYVQRQREDALNGMEKNKYGQYVSPQNNAKPQALGNFAMGEQIQVHGQLQTVAPGGGELYQRLLKLYQAQGNGDAEMAALVKVRSARHSIAAGNGFAQFVADERGIDPVTLRQLKSFEAGGSPYSSSNYYNPSFASVRPFPAGGFGGGNSAPNYRGAFAYGGAFRVGGSGGTDSQLVSFHASPDEVVSVRRPGQMRKSESAEKRPVAINFTVNAPDADSFRRSKTQILNDLAAGVARAQRSV